MYLGDKCTLSTSVYFQEIEIYTCRRWKCILIGDGNKLNGLTTLKLHTGDRMCVGRIAIYPSDENAGVCCEPFKLKTGGL